MKIFLLVLGTVFLIFLLTLANIYALQCLGLTFPITLKTLFAMTWLTGMLCGKHHS